MKTEEEKEFEEFINEKFMLVEPGHINEKKKQEIKETFTYKKWVYKKRFYEIMKKSKLLKLFYKIFKTDLIFYIYVIVVIYIIIKTL